MSQQHHHHHYHHHNHDNHSHLGSHVAHPLPSVTVAAALGALRAMRQNVSSKMDYGATTSHLSGGDLSSTLASTPAPEDSGGNDEYIIILPFIVLFGLCGNIVSLVAIFHSRLRKMAANQYLIVLTISDSVFLMGIVLVLFKVDFTGYFLCVVVEYVLMSASYVSSWSIAALTIERYLAIAHPLKHVQYGYVSRWHIMCFWVPIPFLLNLVQFVTLSPNSDPSDPGANVRKCTVKDGELQMIVELLDVILCYVLPCTIVVVLNLLIASKVESAERIFKKTLPKTSQKMSTTTLTRADSPKISLINHDAQNGESHSKHNGRRLKSKASASSPPGLANSSASSSGSTRILIVVPVVYILLNSPFYLFRIIDTIALNVFKCKAFSIQGGLNDPLILFLYNAAHYLYYVNFACDFVVYAFSSKNFRRTVVIAWRHLLYAKWSNQTDYLESMARNSYNRYTNVTSINEQRTTTFAGPNSNTSISQGNMSVASTANEAPAVHTTVSRSSTQLSRWQRDL